ncbi:MULTISPECIES: hypothetical protein [Streptomyces]|uniref:hypothetical protein n=1 Tax=Streptomyces TaxID=1883 RepID=UPI0002EBF264|nr:MULTISPECIES: hypothetical protein [Streptomyces]MZE79733.1 hypothetical protein [Streptomyces sp. SID5475]
MKNFIGRCEAVTDTDYIELALGTPVELWLGEDGESDEERAARLDAARDILADDPGLADRATRAAVEVIEAHAPELLAVPNAVRPASVVRTAFRTAVAA